MQQGQVTGSQSVAKENEVETHDRPDKWINSTGGEETRKQ